MRLRYAALLISLIPANCCEASEEDRSTGTDSALQRDCIEYSDNIITNCNDILQKRAYRQAKKSRDILEILKIIYPKRYRKIVGNKGFMEAIEKKDIMSILENVYPGLRVCIRSTEFKEAQEDGIVIPFIENRFPKITQFIGCTYFIEILDKHFPGYKEIVEDMVEELGLMESSPLQEMEKYCYAKIKRFLQD